LADVELEDDACLPALVDLAFKLLKQDRDIPLDLDEFGKQLTRWAMAEVVGAVGIAKVQVVVVGGDVAREDAPGVAFSVRFAHHCWHSANSSNRIGFVLEYFLRPSGGGIS
jgi:hypothetical protein